MGFGGGLSFNDSYQSTIIGSDLGISATNNGTGALSITTTGTVIGTTGVGIIAYNSGGSGLTIEVTDVFGGTSGIFTTNSGSGALSIKSTGTVVGESSYGIYANNAATDLTIEANNVSGGESGIYATNFGSGALSITTTGIVTGTTKYGIDAYNEGNNPVLLTVDGSSTVQGAAAGINIDSTTPVDILNAGIIRNLSGLSSDTVISAYSIDGDPTNSVINVNNSGLVLGTVQFADEGNSFVNNVGGTWDTSGGTNDFGALLAGNSLLNNGTIIAANGTASDPVQTTTFNNVGTFTNGGNLTMVNGRLGDTTVINGNYVGNGGKVWFDTVLNGDDSASDKLVINGDTSGTTLVGVNNLGGSGAATLNGIEIIQVNGTSNGEFINDGRIVAGAYDYSVVRGRGANASNWYLESTFVPEPQPDPDPQPNPQPDPEPQPTPTPVERPEAGAYSTNLAAANTMFVTRLHDRLGETQYIDALTGEQKVTSLWLRNEGGHNRSRDDHDQLRTQANRYVLQLGGDIAQWSNNGQDRFHLGLMTGYGNTKSNTVARSGYDAKGSVTGYSVGAYGTWYANQADKSGLYVDGWLQYSWFNNNVNGQGLAGESYKSKGITASIESGYSFKLGENSTKTINYFIQPQAQLTWMGVKADDHTEANGTRVTGEGDGNLQSRLGVKAFMDIHSGADQAVQPFVEANWLHNSKDFGTNMNGISVKQDGAANIAELKLGVEGQVNKQVNLWGNVAQQVGNKGYSDTAVMLGAKYNF
ncbi:type V secretion protein A [Serratia sp. S1B]|nr:type V secretion protein A [Serratia sp. S1B]